MSEEGKEELVDLLKEIRNWIRAAAHGSVKKLLESELPDAKARAAYQLLDGSASMEQVRISCKMSPNVLLALANRCTAAGLMDVNSERKRVRLFDLADFGLLDSENPAKVQASRERTPENK